MGVSPVPTQDKLEVILSVIKELKEIVPQLLSDKRVNTEYIEGEKEAFIALTAAIDEARKSVRTTRFSPHSVDGRQNEFFNKISNIMNDSPIKEFHRIIATNIEKKEDEITKLIANNQGRNFNIYLSKYMYDFELVIIDEKTVFIHFGKIKTDKSEGHNVEGDIISATLKITNIGVAKEFVQIFDNMAANTSNIIHVVHCAEINIANITEHLRLMHEGFSKGFNHFKEKEASTP